MTTTLILVRHGHVDNPRHVLYGRLPGFGLSPLGRKEIKETCRKLSKYPVRYIYTSPLKRARQTSEILAPCFNVKPRISGLINEVRLIFKGMPLVKYKKDIQPVLYDPSNLEKGQESIPQISERMLKFVSIVKKRHSGKTVLAVSHGDPIVILKSVLEGKKFTWGYKMSNYLKTGGFFVFNI